MIRSYLLWASSLRALPFFALVFLLALSGCHRAVTDPNASDFIVAEGKGISITKAQLDEEVKGFLVQKNITLDQLGPAKLPLVQNLVLDQIIFSKLLLAQADQVKDVDFKKLEADELEKAQMQYKMQFNSDTALSDKLKEHGHDINWLKERIHERLVISKVLEQIVDKDVTVSDQEVQDFYTTNQDKFVIGDKIRASRILAQVDANASDKDVAAARKKIEVAQARLQKGEDFGKVAQDLSDDQYSSRLGGDIGDFQKGEQPGYDAIFNLKVGEVSPIFKTPFGFEIAKVTEKHPGGKLTLAQVREDIKAYLVQQKNREKEEAYRKKLLADNQVVRHLTILQPVSMTTGPAVTPTAPESAPASASKP